ncbi:uncharacterized protein LOC127252578 isoform X2 [Andrographis paniculata]|uniref:uncharacterized protein LOC127252578 isoform X2 n=1 Tax=Andrographis paniculata TaxID=175694 RepID=UPI0021E98765|nr:uncharacterized protein LOC127252578 isoform X2 [Andrographis paniculata]
MCTTSASANTVSLSTAIHSSSTTPGRASTRRPTTKPPQPPGSTPLRASTATLFKPSPITSAPAPRPALTQTQLRRPAPPVFILRSVERKAFRKFKPSLDDPTNIILPSWRSIDYCTWEVLLVMRLQVGSPPLIASFVILQSMCLVVRSCHS